MPNRVSRGDVIDVALDPTVGAEIQKTRPCVVVQNDVTNRVSRKTIVVPLTSTQPKKPYPGFVLIPKDEGGLQNDSVALCEQIRVVDEQRFGRVRGRLPAYRMKQINTALKIILELQ